MKASFSLIILTMTGVQAVVSEVLSALGALEPGVTEIHVQPSIDTAEVRALGDVAIGWIDDLTLATSDELRNAVTASGAVLIGYRALRDAMRLG